MNNIDRIIKKEKVFIEKMHDVIQDEPATLLGQYKRNWGLVFIAQSYYFMAMMEKLKK